MHLHFQMVLALGKPISSLWFKALCVLSATHATQCESVSSTCRRSVGLRTWSGLILPYIVDHEGTIAKSGSLERECTSVSGIIVGT
jgi:hypothetical protein